MTPDEQKRREYYQREFARKQAADEQKRQDYEWHECKQITRTLRDSRIRREQQLHDEIAALKKRLQDLHAECSERCIAAYKQGVSDTKHRYGIEGN